RRPAEQLPPAALGVQRPQGSPASGRQSRTRSADDADRADGADPETPTLDANLSRADQRGTGGTVSRRAPWPRGATRGPHRRSPPAHGARDGASSDGWLG